MSGGSPSAVQRERLAALANVILPAWRDLPSASEAGVAGSLLDRALAVLPAAVAATLREILDEPVDDPARFLAELARGNARHFQTLVLVTAAAYYLSPEVRERIGYHGQEALTIDTFELPRYLEDGRLDRVIARGPRYRDVDEPAEGEASREARVPHV